MTHTTLNAQQVVEGLTVSQRIDTAISAHTAQAQYFEDVQGDVVTMLLDDCEHWTVTTLVKVDDDYHGELVAVYFDEFDDDNIEVDASQKAAIEELAANTIAEREADDDDYYDRFDDHGMSNQDFIYGFTA